MPSVLIAGSGGEIHGWDAQGYAVTTLDIDPDTKPDIVASMTDLGEIGEFDAIYCCHALEHLYPHEVGKALAEFYRVLKPNGAAIIMVPDLEGVPATEEALQTSYGSISGLHLYYGQASVLEKQPYMAHHCGFVADTLKRVMEMAGFETKTSRCADYNLLGIGVKPEGRDYWAV